MCALFFVFLVVVIMCADAWAQHPQESAPRQKAPPPSTPEAPKGGHALTAEDIGAFSDGIVPVQLGRDDIAGAVVVVIKDGRVLFAKGYGYADVEKKKPVTVDATLFRPGSISKLFTWTSVMQQVEQGKLDLDKDVNEYLDFKIPPMQGKPITLRNIMTHTPGFEEAIKNLFVPANRMQPLDVYLKGHLPARIYPPGTTIAYSNYATALAGYIVQRVSGMRFEDYVEQNIFRPLQMQRATFRQPLPDALKPLMSNGYQRGSDKPKEFETVQPVPAGSLSTTGEDIAHFMIAHLQDGKYGDASILKTETVQLMHSRQHSSTDNLNGMCLGFYEESANGHRIIGHGGDTMYFHSDLHLVPDVGLGFFISYNSAGKGGVRGREELWRSFLDRYFPYEPPAAQSPGSAADARSVSRAYRSSRGFETSLAKLVSILNEVIVSPGPNNTVQVDAVKEYNGKPKRWREIGPMTFREENGQNRMMFYRDSMGHFTAALDAPPVFVFFRAPWYEDKRFVQAVAIGIMVIFVLTLLLWPIGGLVRRHYGRVLEPQYRSMRVLVRLVCVFDLGVLTVWIVTFTKVSGNIEKLNDSLDPTVRVLQILTLIAAILTLVPLYNLVRSWTTPARWWGAKVHDTLIALACVAFVYLGLVTKLLGFNLRF